MFISEDVYVGDVDIYRPALVVGYTALVIDRKGKCLGMEMANCLGEWPDDAIEQIREKLDEQKLYPEKSNRILLFQGFLVKERKGYRRYEDKRE